jgi:UDP-MurNAc hydroxylase
VRLDYLGQACTLVSAGSAALLSDPWFSGPSHMNGWIPYPAWTQDEIDEIRLVADRATHVFISHDHEDHFDPAFLATLSPKVILLGDFANQRFRSELEQLTDRHTVVYLDHAAPYELADGVTVRVFLEEPRFRTNSIALLECDDGVVLNGNDCGLDTATLQSIARHRPVTVFLYTLNFLANGYPFPYLRRTTPDLYERITALRNEIVGSFHTAMELLRPELSLAFAGPVTFADAACDYLNALPEARNWETMIDQLHGAGLPVAWPAPFSSVEIAEGAVVSFDDRPWAPYELSHPSVPFTLDDELVSADQPERATVAAAARTMTEDLRALRERMGDLDDWAPNLVLTATADLDSLEDGPYLWHEVCRPGAQGELVVGLDATDPLPLPYLQIIGPPALLLALCDNSEDYDGFLLSGRSRYARQPDSFDSVLHNMLRFGRDDLKTDALVEWWQHRDDEQKEMIDKFQGGQLVPVCRRCPHEGELFDLVDVVDGTITCPRHRWVYDVYSGDCLKGDKRLNLFGKSADVGPARPDLHR